MRLRKTWSKTVVSLNDYIMCYTYALKYMPKSSNYCFERGILHYVNRNFPKAIQDMEKAISIQSKPIYKYWLAFVYNKYSVKPKKALSLINEYLYAFPWHYQGHILKSKILKTLGLYKKANYVTDRIPLLKPIQIE